MERFFNREFTFDRVARTLLLALVVVLVILGLRAIWDVLLPFLLAGIFAYVMMPLVRFFQFRMRLRSRGLSVVLTLLVIGALIYLAVIYVVPSVKEEVEKTLQMISSYNGGQDLITMLLPKSVRNYLTSNRTWGNFSRNLSVDKLIENTRLILDQLGGIINSTLSVFSWGFVFLMGIVVPVQIALVPLFIDYSNIGLLDTHLSIIIPLAGFALPMSLFLFMSFFSYVPREVYEAASIDGAGPYRIFARITLPMSLNTVITVVMVNAIFIWNEFVFANTFVLTEDFKTIPLGLQNYIGNMGKTDWTATFSAVAITVTPLLLVFLALNKAMIYGLESGSTKG